MVVSGPGKRITALRARDDFAIVTGRCSRSIPLVVYLIVTVLKVNNTLGLNTQVGAARFLSRHNVAGGEEGKKKRKKKPYKQGEKTKNTCGPVTESHLHVRSHRGGSVPCTPLSQSEKQAPFLGIVHFFFFKKR